MKNTLKIFCFIIMALILMMSFIACPYNENKDDSNSLLDEDCDFTKDVTCDEDYEYDDTDIKDENYDFLNSK